MPYANKEDRNANERRKYAENKSVREKKLALNKAYRQENPEKFRTYSRTWCEKHPDRKVARSKKATDKVRAYVNFLRSSQMCVECGDTRPWVLEFHHRIPENKRFNITCSRTYPLDTILEEASKCDILCASCHAERHHFRVMNL